MKIKICKGSNSGIENGIYEVLAYSHEDAPVCIVHNPGKKNVRKISNYETWILVNREEWRWGETWGVGRGDYVRCCSCCYEG
jgi:hypothetical protein